MTSSNYDVIVIGGGHAGVEAATAAAVTVFLDLRAAREHGAVLA